MKILIVEDDDMIGSSLQKALRKSGYAVDWVQDGQDAEVLVKEGGYSLVIMDLGLPERDGFSILSELRKRQIRTPVLILTARDAISDKVQGLDLGADDYMLKPFALEELEARIRVLLRRQNEHLSSVIEYGDLSIDTATHKITMKDKVYVLSSKEFALVGILIKRPGAIFSRAQLEEMLYGWNEEVGSNAIEVHIHQIRKKLGKNIIKNIRNVGYSLADEHDIN